jgi:hypothetical protein
MLEKEFKYFLDNQSSLVKIYNGKYIVIVGESVIGAFDSEEEAYFTTELKYEPGTFLIQLCEQGEASYTQIFHSRVAFA